MDKRLYQFLKLGWESLEILHGKVDWLMSNISGLDTAIGNLSGEVDSAVAAINSLVAKANGAGIDVSSEIATITGFHDKLLAAVSAATTVTVSPPVSPPVNPPVNPPVSPPVTGA